MSDVDQAWIVTYVGKAESVVDQGLEFEPNKPRVVVEPEVAQHFEGMKRFTVEVAPPEVLAKVKAKVKPKAEKLVEPPAPAVATPLVPDKLLTDADLA